MGGEILLLSLPTAPVIASPLSITPDITHLGNPAWGFSGIDIRDSTVGHTVRVPLALSIPNRDLILLLGSFVVPILRRFNLARYLIDEPESTTASTPNLLQSRLMEALRLDIAVTADLRLLVRGSMDALRATLGDQGWQAAVETVEPVVLAELQRMVA